MPVRERISYLSEIAALNKLQFGCEKPGGRALSPTTANQLRRANPDAVCDVKLKSGQTVQYKRKGVAAQTETQEKLGRAEKRLKKKEARLGTQKEGTRGRLLTEQQITRARERVRSLREKIAALEPDVRAQLRKIYKPFAQDTQRPLGWPNRKERDRLAEERAIAAQQAEQAQKPKLTLSKGLQALHDSMGYITDKNKLVEVDWETKGLEGRGDTVWSAVITGQDPKYTLARTFLGREHGIQIFRDAKHKIISGKIVLPVGTIVEDSPGKGYYKNFYKIGENGEFIDLGRSDIADNKKKIFNMVKSLSESNIPAMQGTVPLSQRPQLSQNSSIRENSEPLPLDKIF